MARTISPSTPAFSNYGDGIHPINKGGFGSNSLETIKANINALDRTNTSTEGGVIPIGYNGIANLAPYGISIITDTISGPKQFNRTATTEYTITNYFALKEYTVSASSGTATRVNDKITLSANIVPEAVILTVNNRNITLTKMPSNITRPLVTLGGIAFNDNKVTITATGTAFASTNGKTHASSTWDIATDVLFTNIVGTSVDNTTDKTTHAFESIDKVPTLYVRVKYKDNAGAMSDWSATVSINTADLAIAVNTPSISITGKKNNTGAKIVGTGSMFVNSDGSTHVSTTWQVASDAGFSTIIHESQNDTVNKNSIVMDVVGVPVTYYVRIRHTSSIGNISGWSNVANIGRGTMVDDIPKNEEAKLVASNPTAGDYFGYSISITSDGSRVAVGARNKTGTASYQGAAYIFSRTGSTWTQEAKLVVNDPTAGDYFGQSISISNDGSRVAVGAYNKSGTAGAGQGAAYIFSRTGTTWTQEAKLVASNPTAGDYFGHSISISNDGSRVAVGAYYKTGTAIYQGAAYIFSRSGTTWTQEAKLVVNDPATNDRFGYSISITSDGSRVAVGASYKSGTAGAYQGAAYIFSRTGTTWTQEAKLVASDPATNDYFGHSISISNDGSRVAVGAYYKTGTAIYQGAAYIFSRSGTTWTQEAKLVASDPATNDYFGHSISISNDGSRVAVGAYNKTDTANQQGAAYIFSRTGTTWTQEAKLVASDPANNDQFGQSISISNDGSRVAVGASYKTGTANQQGAAYIFS